MHEYKLSEKAAALSSLIWESQGWTQTPCANKYRLPKDFKVKVTRPKHVSEKQQLFTDESFDPKVQISKRLPLGYVPKDVIVKQLKRSFSEVDRREVLNSITKRPEIIRPSEILFRDKAVRLRKAQVDDNLSLCTELGLHLFDDEELDMRMPEEWLQMGKRGNVQKAVPGVAYIHRKYRSKSGEVIFEWQDVAVLKYCPKMNMYLVRRRSDCPPDGIEELTLKTLENAKTGCFDDIWVPRIYLTFCAEDPFRFALRFSAAVDYRRKIQESLRYGFYIDSMPTEGLPLLYNNFIKDTLTTACSIIPKPTPEWVQNTLPSYAHGIQLMYHRTLNRQIYEDITQQKPCLMDEIPYKWMEFPLASGYNVKYSFKEKAAEFVNKTYWTRAEVIESLYVVQEQMLVLLDKPFYRIPLPSILPIDEFVALQNKALTEMTEFIHSTWINNVTNGIKSKLRNCGKGYYDISEDDWFIYSYSKLKKLMTAVSFKMQDTTRTVVVNALEKFAQLISEACHNILDLPDNFVWTEGFASKKRRPLKDPLFQVDAVLKSIHLEYASDLPKYHGFVIKLFNDALGTITNIHHPEKYVMESMLVAEKRILEIVGHDEDQIARWRRSVVTGMDKALIAMEAYARSYDSALSCLALDQITYIKNCERQKKKYNELKELIEYHMKEKQYLSETIPDSIDIGPFRVVTRSVKLTAVKKHETLAQALLGYFSSKLRDHMEDINQKFINLQEQIKQPCGNIENLLEQEKWLETVPSEIENLSVDVKQMKADYKQLAAFHFVFNDEEFSLYWWLIGLPYKTVLVLENRIENLDSEKEYLRTLLAQDHAQLQSRLEELTERVEGFSSFLDLQNASAFQIQIRKTRKDVDSCRESAVLYNMRENLFEAPITSYKQIETLSEELEPFELLWNSIAEFFKWRERDTADFQIDEVELRDIVDKSYSKLSRCLTLFSDPSIIEIVVSMKKEMEEYRFSRFGIAVPERASSDDPDASSSRVPDASSDDTENADE